MWGRISLRTRIFLSFAFLGVGAVGIVAAALAVGHGRAGGDPSGYLSAGAIASFGILGLTAGIWLLFDENVAKPIERLAADLRSRAHADVSAKIDHGPALFLGDLAPAAAALSQRVGEQNVLAAERIASETARLAAERSQLTAVLSQIPVAVIMVSADHRIVLYDGQAAHALEPVRPLCLGQPLSDYVDGEQIARAVDEMISADRMTHDLQLSTVDGTRVFEANLRRLADGAGYMLTFQSAPDARAERPLAFDFDLFAARVPERLRDTRLSDLVFVVFDTETTGLLPEKDEVVQIGAVRIVNGRLVDGEALDMLVNPGRPIPVTSTEVHGISDRMVADAPTMAEAGGRFHHFAKGAVLVAHNAPFDMAFLGRWADHSGRRFDNPVLDTVLLSAVLFGAGEAHSLDAIAARLGIEIADAARHTALGDAEATAAVFLKMLPMLEARGFANFGEVVDAQRRHSRILPDLNPG